MKIEVAATLGLLLGSTAAIWAQDMPADPAKMAPKPAAVDPTISSAPTVDCDGSASCDHRFSFGVSYLLWWFKDERLPIPLVTTGNPNDPVPAAIGQPGTTVVYGNQNVDFGTTNGYRLDAGYALDPEACWTLEGSWFQLEKRASQFSLASDANGNPVIGRPIIGAISGQEAVELVSFATPFQFQGTVAIENTSRLFGWEVNLARNRIGMLSGLDLLIGVRSLNLLESLTINELFVDTTGFPGGAGLTFLGPNNFVSGPIATLDRITTSNQFYGPQIGARYGWDFGRLAVDMQGKVAVGWTREVVNIEGISVLQANTAGGLTAPQSAPGGVLAQITNIGEHAQTEHAVVPEFNINLSYRINSWMEARLGYSFIYWSTLDRPGNLLDRTVSRTLVPTDQNYGPTGTEVHPEFLFSRSNFWAQGFNLGLELQY